ncbi:U32 family peptidase [Shewanella halifaxensis]|uniref:U32 family peptidase n=1 Tax=Shewanella halifaxensis TaxID=271098 RepID=UPI000D5A17EF|nr:U32 family peptidase [Shewanella halifaxensis]
MKDLELLAPGGDIASIKAAIIAGADAVYCGLNSFNARTRAENLSFEELHGLLRIAHKHGCKLFLTLNIIVLEHELPALLKLLNQLANTAIDGVIVQDLGLFYLLKQHYPSLDIHASTQVTTHNTGQLTFLANLGASRVNLCRELNLEEIKLMSDKAHSMNMLTEVFVHGSNCIGFSGVCYFSSAYGGNSGNRGRCSQPCRDQYQTTKVGAQYPLNLKDNSAYADLAALYAAGADSLKVEGRIKKYHYVHRVIETWRNQINRLRDGLQISSDKKPLFTVFNRDFSNGYLQGAIGKSMYIDNPRDNAVQHFSKITSLAPANGLATVGLAPAVNVKKALYDEKTQIIEGVGEQIAQLSLAKPAVSLLISGKLGQQFTIRVQVREHKYSLDLQPQCREFTVTSHSILSESDKYALTVEELTKRFQGLNYSEYQLAELNFDQLQASLFVPFKEVSEMRQQILIGLNQGRLPVEPVSLKEVRSALAVKDRVNDKAEPAQLAQNVTAKHAKLALLLTNRQDLVLLDNLKQQAKLQHNPTLSIFAYYLIPDAIAAHSDKLMWIFKQQPDLIPWFGAVIMERDLVAAKAFLESVRPKQIVTNNTGVAVLANELGIDWIAGPYLNISNSLSLYSLQQQGCSGAFLSNELNCKQLKAIKPPRDFSLHYSIYHPLMLMVSRQCLFLQSSGCRKSVMDEECLTVCKKQTLLNKLDNEGFVIDKKRGEYNALYSEQHFYNPLVLADLNSKFDSVLIDLRAVRTQSEWQTNLLDSLLIIIKQLTATEAVDLALLNSLVTNTTRAQYLKGL